MDLRQNPKPSYATPHEGLPDESAAIAATSMEYGTRLMPWQCDALSVVTQHDAEGGYRHPMAIISVPRQSGKTELIKALCLHRLRHSPTEWHGVMTSTTRKEAADHVMQRWARVADQWPDLVIRRGIGNERLRLGLSSIQPFSPQPDALHGRTLDTVILDEAWSLAPDRGREILQAAIPAQITRPYRQLIMISTAGSPESVWFREWVERGRSGDVCYIEYSGPSGASLDGTGWESWHPAFGITINRRGVEAARASFGDDESGFRRAFLNQWPDVVAIGRLIDEATWDALCDDEVPMPERGSVALGIDVDPGGESSSIAAAWRDSDSVRLELCDFRPGVHWLTERVPEVMAKHGVREVWSQDFGPVRASLDRLETARVKVKRIASKDASAATEAWLSDARGGRYRVTRSSVLDDVMTGIATRAYGDSVQWERRAGITSPITSTSWAAWGLRRRRGGELRIIVAS